MRVPSEVITIGGSQREKILSVRKKEEMCKAIKKCVCALSCCVHVRSVCAYIKCNKKKQNLNERRISLRKFSNLS